MNLLNKHFIFVRFPIYLPIIYFFILEYFPDYELHLIALTILLLAEPHFGATLPIFLNKVNHPYILQKTSTYLWCYFCMYIFNLQIFSI